MAKLDNMTLLKLEEVLGMKSGYVLDFSNDSLDKFVKRSIDINIYEDKGYEEHCSKANKLRDVFDKESIQKVHKLIQELLNYYCHYKMKKNELTTFDKISISDIKQGVKRSYKLNNNEKNSNITRELDQKMQMISTRQARFKEMSLDEKLAEIGNLIENLLKKEGKYLSLNYSDFSLGFIDNDDVIKLRKTVQCFRHSTDESLEERKTYTKIQKKFMVEYGIIICEFIYMYLKEN